MALCCLVFFSLCRGEEGEGTPAFRRQLLPAERLAEELKRVQDGVLVRLPAAEFDALVERAARAGKRKVGPQLLEARYHAMLKGESLIGEGQWKLIHNGPGPGLLNLQPFNLALRQARFENGDALIAAFDGKTPALLVEKTGERTVSLDWSARAESGPEGLQFHLALPPSPVALLELDVPAGRAVKLLNDDAVLSGPHEAEKNDLRRWKIVCGGRPRVDVRIYPAERPAAETNPPPAPFVHQKTTQKLHPDGLDATFELTLDGLPNCIRELICEADAVLRLRDVAGPGVEDYSFQAGEGNKPSRLTIRLREPIRAGTWKIRCLAPLDDRTSAKPGHVPSSGGSRSIAWRSPGLHLVNSVPRGETLAIWLHPDLRVESWEPGSYRLGSLDIDRATGSQILTLLGGGLGPPRRPAVRLQAFAIDFSTQQLTWWRCNAAGMSLTVQIGWDVSQGQLFQLPVLLPEGWEVEKVEMAPAALLRDWHIRKRGDKATLLVDLAAALGPRLSSDSERVADSLPRPALSSSLRSGGSRLPALTLQLRPAQPGPIAEKLLRFPDAVPLGARIREGALALDYDEQLFHLQVQTAAERTEPESDGPWGQQLPDFYFRYHGQPLTGEIQVRPRPPRLRAKCENELLAAGGEAVVESHLILEAEVGSPNTIELLLSAGDGEAWQWRTEAPRGEEATANRVRRAERVYSNETAFLLHLLASPHPLQAAAVAAARPTRERWRLVLARPLRVREPLRLHARRRLQPRQNRWEVPLPIVLGAQRMEGEVVLHLADAGLALVRSIGLHESASTQEKAATPWRTFRYGPSEVSLVLSGEGRATDRSNIAAIENARLITYVGENGVLRHHLSFQVSNWGERTFPLRLPSGSRPLAVGVDGLWLPQLFSSPPASSNDANGDSAELALPAPNRANTSSGGKYHIFEIVYSSHLPATWLWQSLDASLPQMPITAIAIRRIWRLSPKLTPLHRERYRRQPGTSDTVESAALPRHALDLFHLPGSLDRFDPLLGDPQSGAQEVMNQAVQKLYARHADQKLTLREVVSAIAFECIKGRYSVIMDEVALGEAGGEAETRATIKRTPPWDEYGLIAVPARGAILLTTKSGRGATLREPLSEEIENALVDAARHGQDASGRFRSALNWLYPESRAGRLDFEIENGDWSEWEPITGQAEERLIVVRREAVTALGLALGLSLALLLGLPRRWSVRRRLTLLLAVLALSGLGALWLPAALRDLAWWPLLAAGAVAAAVYLKAILVKPASPQSATRQPKSASSSAAVTGMLVLAIFGWNGRAAAPGPATVYLVPASADAPDKQTVLAPADLLDRLKALAQATPLVPGGPQSVLLDATYEGQLVEAGKQAEFTALFFAHSLSDEPATLIVPLAGVQMVGEVLLDGARVAPLAAPQAGYSLRVRGRGRHKIEMRFRVPVIGTEEDRNVLFTAPPLLRSRLSWRVPAGAVAPQVLVKNGAQWRTQEGQRLEADLGALPLPVHLHWYQPNRPLQASYRAAYLWNLGLEVNRLTAYLRYRVEQGAIKTLEVDIPAELEVSSANAQRTLSFSRSSWRSRVQLRDWYVTRTGDKRLLHLELPYPISGDFQVTLELLPRTPLTSPAALPLPWPRSIRADGPHYLAYRTQAGLNARRETSQNLTRIDNQEFAPDWLGVPSLEANFQGIAYRIPPDKIPQLLLHLEHTPPLVQGEIDVKVHVDSQRAEIETVAEVAATSKDLAAVEWELSPNCVLVAASGEEVRSWKQNGSRLLVWLNRTTTKTRIHLSGWLPLSRRDGRAHLEMIGPRLLHANKLHTRLRLAATGDLTLAAVQTHDLQPTQSAIRNPKSEVRTRDEILDFETDKTSYRLNCQVQSAANAIARVLTLAETVGRELRFTTTVNYTVTHGELRQVRLRLRNWEDEKIELQAERMALLPAPRRVAGERSWQLPLQAGVRGHYQVTLRGSMPLEKAAGGVPMPEVLVQGVERVEYFVAVSKGELIGQAAGSLQPVKAEIQNPQFDPAIANLLKSGGHVWRVSGSEWQMRLLPQTRELQPAPVRVYLTEQWAAVEDQRWLYEARCWLRHEAHANLILDFAAPVRVLAASIDGVEALSQTDIRNPRSQSENGISDFGLRISDLNKRVWLHLPGQSGVRCVRFRWVYDPAEPLDRPNLSSPQLAGTINGLSLWTILVPSGWQASLAGASGWQGAVRDAHLALWRADAQLRMSQDLAAERQDGVVSAALAGFQHRFDSYCRHAHDALEWEPDLGSMTGPAGQSLSSWLEELRAKGRLLAKSRAAANTIAQDRFAKWPDFENTGGTSLSWQVLPGTEPLTIQLASRQSEHTRQALAASVWWLGILAAVWGLSLLPFLRTRLRLFWPEQIALVGAIGWHLAGLTSIVLGLLSLAVCGRVLLLIGSVRAFVRKRRGQPSTMTPSAGAMP